MWDIQRGSAVRMFTGHTGNVTCLAASPDGKMLASADDKGDVIVWDLAAGRLIKRLRGHARGGVWALDWSVESSVLASGGMDGTVRIWDVQPFSTANHGTNNTIGSGNVEDAKTTTGDGFNTNGVNNSNAVNGIDSVAATSGSNLSNGVGGGSSSITNSITNASTTVNAGNTSGIPKKTKGKDVIVSPEQISAFPTKKSPIYELRFTQMNLVMAGGVYLP